MSEIVPITPQHILGHLRMAGATVASKYGNSQKNVARSRRLPGQKSHSAGWVTESINRNGEPALKIRDRVVTPAEGVKLSYNTNGVKMEEDRANEEAGRLTEHLRNNGFTVTPAPSSTSMGITYTPSNTFFVTKYQ